MSLLARAALDLDTAARNRPEILAEAARDPAARAIAVAASGQLRATPAGVTAPLAGRAPLAYLGRHGGAPLLLVDAANGPDLADLRRVGADLDPAERAFATVAVAVRRWQGDRHCVACGHETDLTSGGWVARCPACGAERYPRTDPCVIVAVTDGQDRLLLARAAHYPPGRASVLAGYVEPGESLEAAVHREIGEEANLRLDAVRYLGSQPWPFPRSLMCSFTARAADPGQLRVDGAEILQARFYSRAEVRDRSAAGDLTLPPGISIARTMVERWLAGEIA